MGPAFKVCEVEAFGSAGRCVQIVGAKRRAKDPRFVGV